MKYIVAVLALLSLATHAPADDSHGKQKKPPETRREAQDLMDDAAKDFASIQASHNRIVESHETLTRLAQQAVLDVKSRVDRLQDLIRSKAAQETLLEATKGLQEAQESLNLRYVQLQSQMQSENRTYTALSNVMKTKHDTVKNSISNIR